MKSHLIKKIGCLFALFATFSLCPFFVYAAPAPKDISTHWAKGAIQKANNEGWAYIVNQKFYPTKLASRQEVVLMLVNALKSIKANGYNPNKKADLTKYKDYKKCISKQTMSIALGNKLIKGYYDKTIKPQANITRAELAVLLSRLLPDKQSGIFCPFTDYIPTWALESVKRAYKAGVVGGYPNGNFGPNKKLTKAEALVMIAKFRNLQDKRPDQNKIPAEFKQIQKLITGVSINENSLSDSINLSLVHSDFDDSFLLIIKPTEDKPTLEKIKKTLQAFYPTSYETVYNKTLDLINKKIIVESETFDGRSFSCKYYTNTIMINIGRKQS
jgi:hypothetical protein